MTGILASKMEELGYDEVWTEFNIPTLGYSPGEEIYAHVPDERISLDFISRSILGNAAIAYQLMKDWRKLKHASRSLSPCLLSGESPAKSSSSFAKTLSFSSYEISMR